MKCQFTDSKFNLCTILSIVEKIYTTDHPIIQIQLSNQIIAPIKNDRIPKMAKTFLIFNLNPKIPKINPINERGKKTRK